MDRELFRKLVEAAGISGKDLAEEMKCSKTLIYFYLDGSRPIPEAFSVKVTAFLKKRAIARVSTSMKTIQGLEEDETGARV